MIRKLFALLLCAAALTGCRLDPPLRLADQGTTVEVIFPEVVTEFSLIWDIDYEWESQWWYGWDQYDEQMFGPLRSPDPESFEARISYFGEERTETLTDYFKQTVYGTRITKRMLGGHYDLMLWSNIPYMEEGQALRIDESDVFNIVATTSQSSMAHAPALSPSSRVNNNPEVFYSGQVLDFYVSKDPADYDYYDAERDVYVKKINASLYPMVYTYLVQVLLFNNNGRVTGMDETPYVSSMADAVSLHTGRTSLHETTIPFQLKMKKDLNVADTARADIFGGKLTTFGLCDIEPRSRSDSRLYDGSRADLQNRIALHFHFSNSRDSAYVFDVTPQMQTQIHGGVITIPINIDTLKIPIKNGPSSGFKPTVEPSDSISHEFEM